MIELSHLAFTCRQWKHQNNERNLFKVNNTDRHKNDVNEVVVVSVFIVNFQQI